MDCVRVQVKIAILAAVLMFLTTADARHPENPDFVQPIVNMTAAVGREAILECVVKNLGIYKVAWLRVDTQTILTIHSHIITKNHRIGVTHAEQRTWSLHIKEVKESDRGWYMCQINTDPMKSQIGFLDVVVSPDILDDQTSMDVAVPEGSNVTLKCTARGMPKPGIVWKRENSLMIQKNSTLHEVLDTSEGTILSLLRVTRKQMGPYLCIASNGVPPSVSKRIMLIVQFPPMIWIQYQLIGAYDGQRITLECNSEAYPKSINYWTRDKGDIVPQSDKYEPIIIEESYKVHMRLILKNIEPNDYGIYKCISKNSIGETDGTINVYRIPRPPVTNKTLQHRRRNSTHNIGNTYHVIASNEDEPGSLSLEEKSNTASKTMKCTGLLYLYFLISIY